MVLSLSVEIQPKFGALTSVVGAEYSEGWAIVQRLMLCQAIGEIVVKTFKVADRGFWSGSRGVAPVAFARQISMYLAHVVCGLNFTQIGLAFERDRTTVSHACCLIEDRRDDAPFDDVLDTLEHSILCLLDTGLYSRLSGEENDQWV